MKIKSMQDKCQELLESFNNSLVFILKNSTLPYSYIEKQILNPFGNIAPTILKKFGESELISVCKKIKDLIVITVPERTTIEEVIEDFHHHYRGNRGYKEVCHPAHYEISRGGIRQAKNYINETQNNKARA